MRLLKDASLRPLPLLWLRRMCPLPRHVGGRLHLEKKLKSLLLRERDADFVAGFWQESLLVEFLISFLINPNFEARKESHDILEAFMCQVNDSLRRVHSPLKTEIWIFSVTCCY